MSSSIWSKLPPKQYYLQLMDSSYKYQKGWIVSEMSEDKET